MAVVRYPETMLIVMVLNEVNPAMAIEILKQ